MCGGVRGKRRLCGVGVRGGEGRGRLGGGGRVKDTGRRGNVCCNRRLNYNGHWRRTGRSGWS